MELYDMHSHILPDFDDGAKDVKESLVLINSLKKQGVNNICLTSHFYTNEMSIEDFVRKRNAAFEVLKPHIPEDVKVVVGAEVYVTQFMFNTGNDLSKITYGNSRFILTEFPYNSNFNERTMQQFNIIIQNHGLIPVMPHVERYEYLIDHPSAIEELKDMGVVIQTNISNYSNKAPFFKKRKLLKLIDMGLIDILGSDAHSLDHNTPEVFEEAINTISTKCGRNQIIRMMDIASKIFNNSL